MKDDKIQVSEVISGFLKLTAKSRCFSKISSPRKEVVILGIDALGDLAKNKKVAPRINKGWEHTKEGWRRLKEPTPSTPCVFEEDLLVASALCVLMPHHSIMP